MGESLASVQEFATPLEKASTSSLEALQAFTLGQEEHQKTHDDAALPHLQKAIELDPNFAMAYATLGVSYSNLGRSTESSQALRKAYELRDRVSEREKLYIEAHYYDEVTLDMEKAVAVYQQWLQTYPRDTVPYDNAALALSLVGRNEKALELASQAHRIDPQDRYAYSNMDFSYEALDRLDEAKSLGEEAVAKKLDSNTVHLVLLDVAYLRGDRAAAQQELDRARGTRDEPFLLFFNAGWTSALGRVSAAREQWQQCNQEFTAVGAKDFAASLLALEGYFDALYGYTAEARQEAAQSVSMSNDSDALSQAAGTFAVVGDFQKSSALVASLEKNFPDNRYLQWTISAVKAIEDTQKDQPAAAITLLEAVRPYEMGIGPHSLGVTPAFLRGMAYLKMHDAGKATAEFQQVLSHRGVAAFAPEYPLSLLNLGRAYVSQADNAKARTAYQDFFAYWKDADPDIPVLKTARAEYEKLK